MKAILKVLTLAAVLLGVTPPCHANDGSALAAATQAQAVCNQGITQAPGFYG